MIDSKDVAAEGVRSTFTPGPWQVVVDERPHFLGGKHIERRIFTAWDHPQMKGPIGVVNGTVGIPEVEGGRAYQMVSISEADGRLIAAATDLLHTLAEATGMLSACIDILGGRQRASQNAADEMRSLHNKCLALLKLVAPAKATLEPT